MENLQLYEAVREVPQEAVKEIQGGRLKGLSDINPMWRIKKLTEMFGPCGIGWKYTLKEKRLESTSTGETAAFVDIDLFYRWEGRWSEAIPGTGGSAFVAKERNGPYTNDDCFKMALTDAISVACKALGIGADIYWQTDKSKYEKPKQTAEIPRYMTEERIKVLYELGAALSYSDAKMNGMIFKRYGKKIHDLKAEEYQTIWESLSTRLDKKEEGV